MRNLQLRSIKILYLIAMCGFISSCSSLRPKEDSFKALEYQAHTSAPPITQDYTEKEIQPPASPQIKSAAGKGKSYKTIPLTFNSSIKKWINYFSVKDRKRFQRFLNRGEPYKPYIQAVLSEYDLPTDLYYLAMIESGFSRHAKSRASAVGVWQFMRGTGRDYGLRVDQYIDERRDHIRATEAAASFLRDLYNSLGSWNLAVAAYNCGESRVRRVVRKARTRNFWKLQRRKLLPRETRNYVPKFMAAIIIGKNPTKFGFKVPAQKPHEEVSRVLVPGALKLSSISQVSQVGLDVLKLHNPHLRRNMTPRNRKSYEIWVPKDKSTLVSSKYRQLVQYRVHRSKSTKKTFLARSYSHQYHRVRKGQNLTKIALKYGRSVSYLKRINNLISDKITPNQKILISAPNVARQKYHLVKRGQNLGGIAAHYGKSIKSLKRVNNLRSSKIFVGQRLKLMQGSYSPSSHKFSSRSSAAIHRVRSGENLGLIARKYSTTVRDLKKANGLRRSKIFVGQRLKISHLRKISKSKRKVRKYRVKRGDNLIKISRRFGTSTQKLRRANRIKGSKLYAGQILHIIL